MFILCTRASHRGRGLAGQLVKTALENAKSEGLTGVFSMGLSNYSQRIFRRMGFVERNSLEYSQYTQVDRNYQYKILLKSSLQSKLWVKVFQLDEPTLLLLSEQLADNEVLSSF